MELHPKNGSAALQLKDGIVPFDVAQCDADASSMRRKNVPPETWGYAAWIFLHAAAYAYPDNPTPEEKLAYKQLFMNLRYTLPCYSCRANLVKELEKFPITDAALTNSRTLGTWLNELHNSVSARLNKPVMGYEQRLATVLKGIVPPPRMNRNAKNRMGLGADAGGSTRNIGIALVVSGSVFIIVILVLVLVCRKRKN